MMPFLDCNNGPTHNCQYILIFNIAPVVLIFERKKFRAIFDNDQCLLMSLCSENTPGYAGG